MRFIFQFPETTGTEADMLDAGPLRDVAIAAERAGFYGIALTEHPVPGARWLENGGHQSLDPLVALGYAAGATTSLRLLTNLVVAPYRNPFLLAKAAATVDKLSGGRLILGLGAGYQKSEFYALGIDFEERNALFDEALDALPLHWSGEPFSFEGRHFDARGVIARPRPVQNPIPIWIGGNSRLSRRRAATKAQGWMPMMGGPQLVATARTVAIESLAQLTEMIKEVKEAAVAAGRDGHLDFLSSYQGISGKSPADDADRHRAAIAGIEAAGVTHMIISVDSRAPGQTLEFIEAFGATYLSGAPAGSESRASA
jgi:probable F420-dependent oxidoreductase